MMPCSFKPAMSGSGRPRGDNAFFTMVNLKRESRTMNPQSQSLSKTIVVPLESCRSGHFDDIVMSILWVKTLFAVWRICKEI